MRITAHRITDALLGALTGEARRLREPAHVRGARWTKNQRIFRLRRRRPEPSPRSPVANDFAVAPTWGANGSLFFASSHDYAPFAALLAERQGAIKPVLAAVQDVRFYGVAFSKDYSKMAVAVADGGKSWLSTSRARRRDRHDEGIDDGARRRTPCSAPRASSRGSAAIRTTARRASTSTARRSRRPASARRRPEFCDTEDGVRLVYSVSVGNDMRDLVMSDDQGRGTSRLTQGQGSNTFPACSPDGRLLAFFSTRKNQPGIYMMSLKRFTSQLLTSKIGESLRWAALPPTK